MEDNNGKKMKKCFQNKPYKALGLTIIALLMVLYGVVFGVDALLPAQSNLTLYYSFDRSSGTNVPNLVNITNNGTTTNMEDADWVNGFINNSLIFDGVNEHVNSQFAAFPMDVTEFTVNAWFNSTDASVPRTIFDTQRAGGGRPRMFCAIYTNEIIKCNTYTNAEKVLTGNYTSKEWQMVTITWKNEGNFSMYINGSLANTTSTTGMLNEDYGVFKIGLNYLGLSAWHGKVDEVGVWKQELNLTEISWLYNNGTGRSFYYPYFENSITYNPIASSSSTETFILNIKYDSTYTGTNVYLTYNNTNYTTTASGSSDNKTFTSTITIPTVIGTAINKSFYFDIGLINSTGTYYFHSSINNQTVTNLSIDNCTTGTYQLFNLSLYNEDDSAFLNGITENTSIEVSFEIKELAGTVIANYSKNFNQTNPARICLSNSIGSSQYRLDGIIKYSSSGRFTEYYNFQNYTLTNSTMNITIPLYDLLTSNGQEFKITYKDSNFNPVSGATIELQRKYIGEGIFKTVERPKTSAEGYVIGHLVINDAVYNILVYKEGKLLAIFEDVIADCQNPTLTTCIINLNEYGSFSIPSDFTNYNDILFNINYEETTRIISSTFSIPSGIPSLVTLNVTLFDTLGNTSVCAHSLFTSGGVLSCTVPISFGNSTVIINLYKSGELVGYSILKLKQEPSDIYGHNIIFLSLLIFLLFVGIGASSDSPMLMGLFIILGSIVLVALNFIYTPSFIGAGATILWFIVCVILVLIKGSNRM